MPALMDFLLAQAHSSADLVERLARTPLYHIVWFAAVCTALRIVAVSLLPRVAEYNKAGRISLRILHDAFDALIYAAIVVFLLLRPYVLQTFKIPSESMVPTLKVNDWLIVNKFAYRTGQPKFGDIVVFKPPKRALAPWQPPDQDFVKRLIGEPGDLVEIRNSVLYRNGKAIKEPYLNERTIGDFKLVKYNGELIPIVRFGDGNIPPDSLYVDKVPASEMSAVWELPAERVPKGFYLMMGDNRNWSADGRVWGFVPRAQIVGRAWFILFPFSRMGSPH